MCFYHLQTRYVLANNTLNIFLLEKRAKKLKKPSGNPRGDFCIYGSERATHISHLHFVSQSHSPLVASAFYDLLLMELCTVQASLKFPNNHVLSLPIPSSSHLLPKSPLSLSLRQTPLIRSAGNMLSCTFSIPYIRYRNETIN